MTHIILTGGGSAGHVTPHLAILPHLKSKHWQISYIGSTDGIEREIIGQQGISYYPIASGKLRRYGSVKNFTDPFRILYGCLQAYLILGQLQPQVVFSKGGFVTVPVVIAAWLRRIPVVAHESDLTPGLANRLATPFIKTLCVTFPETAKGPKTVVTGPPLREAILKGDAKKGYQLCQFNTESPVVLVIGGSLGAKSINDAIRDALPELLQTFQIVHICGKGKLDASLEGKPGYKQFEFVSDPLPDFMAMATYAVSRAGSNSIFEFLALRMPSLLVPLSAAASRGDQIQNAHFFERYGFARVTNDEDLDADRLITDLNALVSQRQNYVDAMTNNASWGNGRERILNEIEACIHNQGCS